MKEKIYAFLRRLVKGKILKATSLNYDMAFLCQDLYSEDVTKIYYLRLSDFYWFSDYTYESLNHDVDQYLELNHGVNRDDIVLRIFETSLLDKIKDREN